MKVLYSQLKKYLPDLNADPKEVSQAFTIIGYMLDKFFEVEYLGEKDFLLDLEVRQNRADCFGVMGLVRELSAYYNIPVKLPEEFNTAFTSTASEAPNIEVRATQAVKRLMAVKFGNVKIEQSPEWLREYLAFYDVNSINTLVDLTNYVMIETGHPSHAFDWDLVEGGRLIWEINPIFKKMITLDNVAVELTPDTLLVTNEVEPLAIAGVKGGKSSAIHNETKNVLLEMAVYDGGLIRRNARGIRLLTEASQRLEKFMDPESIPEAFNILVNLILKYVPGVEISSSVYDNYIQKTPDLKIELELSKVSQIAGIEITAEECKTYLERLGFRIINEEGGFITVNNALNRLDVELPEDLIEEIIRLKGYDQIPVDQLFVEATKDITPSILKLTDQVQAMLAARGYDEVRSWVLVDTEKNSSSSYSENKSINVTNSINEEVPTLRQSISVSILGQLENYKKNNISDINIFEVGKVFSDLNNGAKDLERYEEHYSIAILKAGKDLNSLKLDIESILRNFGVTNISYSKAVRVPESAHPATCFDVKVGDDSIGILYVTNKVNTAEESVLVEISLTLLDELMSRGTVNKAVEVESKLVDLDVNLSLGKVEDVNKVLTDRLSPFVDNIWKFEIVDKFEKSPEEVKYTVRIYYYKLNDTEAKTLHDKIFS